ncbi:MAG TPA: 16S rRNA (guanine(527)-N(7))-methyltransferase RsmG [Acetobacteraceae bacterium]|nr:16S rRNA (guanine(527)-N(7))-methyltransferase RsmG [Acetobacteraceae bacterium]
MLSEPVELAPEVERRLRFYAELLARWTQRINLVSRGDAAQIWGRHVLDSLRLLPLIPPGTSRGIDLGSGAGLPGLVLAVASGITFDLVESDRRKAAFLMEAARVTGAPVLVHAERIERLDLEPAPLVTARALAPLDALLGLAAPHLAPGGTALFPKGEQAGDEIEAARRTWRFGLEIAGETHAPILVVTRPERV